MVQKCPFCLGNLSTSIPYPGQTDTVRRPAFRQIGICDCCGGGQAFPAPLQQDLDRFYSGGEYWHAAGSHSQLAHAASQAQIRLTACLPYLDSNMPMSVADVGAGHGFIGRELARSGLIISRYDCVEPDEAAIAHATTFRLPFPFRNVSTIEELESGFNLFFLNQVIEHVADPLPLLEQIISRARPGAIVYVETPNSDSNFKSDVFPHTLFYSPRAFEFLGNRLSLETLRCEKFGLWPAPRHTLHGLLQRLASRAVMASSWLGPSLAPDSFDRLIWRYNSIGLSSCIWLRWIFRIPGNRV